MTDAFHRQRNKKKTHQSIAAQARRFSFAEGEGFKPPIPERGIPDFESSAIDHSANLPISQNSGLPQKIGCKDKVFF